MREAGMSRIVGRLATKVLQYTGIQPGERRVVTTYTVLLENWEGKLR
jgi:hypothetical protein